MFIWQIPGLSIRLKVDGLYIKNARLKDLLTIYIKSIENIPLYVVCFFIKVNIYITSGIVIRGKGDACPSTKIPNYATMYN